MSYDLFLIITFVLVILQGVFIFLLFWRDLPAYRYNKQNEILCEEEKQAIFLDIGVVILLFFILTYFWETHLEYVKKLMGL